MYFGTFTVRTVVIRGAAGEAFPVMFRHNQPLVFVGNDQLEQFLFPVTVGLAAQQLEGMVAFAGEGDVYVGVQLGIGEYQVSVHQSGLVAGV